MNKENYAQTIEQAFKDYYEKSHGYRGDWPDTFEDFVKRVETDEEFAEKWLEKQPTVIPDNKK